MAGINPAWELAMIKPNQEYREVQLVTDEIGAPELDAVIGGSSKQLEQAMTALMNVLSDLNKISMQFANAVKVNG